MGTHCDCLLPPFNHHVGSSRTTSGARHAAHTPRVGIPQGASRQPASPVLTWSNTRGVRGARQPAAKPHAPGRSDPAEHPRPHDPVLTGVQPSARIIGRRAGRNTAHHACAPASQEKPLAPVPAGQTAHPPHRDACNAAGRDLSRDDADECDDPHARRHRVRPTRRAARAQAARRRTRPTSPG